MPEQKQITIDELVALVPNTPAPTSLLVQLSQLVTSPLAFRNLTVADLDSLSGELSKAIQGAVNEGLAIANKQAEVTEPDATA